MSSLRLEEAEEKAVGLCLIRSGRGRSACRLRHVTEILRMLLRRARTAFPLIGTGGGLATLRPWLCW